MPGTFEGGQAAARTNIAKYGRDFYKRIGAIGGAASSSGGFGQGEAGRKRASLYGRLGGYISRKGDTPKLSKRQVRDIRKRILEEQSDMQTQKLSQKYGVQRPW